MGICKIQKPTGKKDIHGDIFVKIICNGVESEPVKYEGDKGDLYLNLICEESDDEPCLFCLCENDNEDTMKNKIETMQEQINDLYRKINANNL